jgi:hypothetical protein
MSSWSMLPSVLPPSYLIVTETTQILFTKTRILSIKVQTLDCFTAMVKTLDKATLTTKLVPLLAKIKTKEPAVMVCYLAQVEKDRADRIDGNFGCTRGYGF